MDLGEDADDLCQMAFEENGTKDFDLVITDQLQSLAQKIQLRDQFLDEIRKEFARFIHGNVNSH